MVLSGWLELNHDEFRKLIQCCHQGMVMEDFVNIKICSLQISWKAHAVVFITRVLV